MIAGPLGKQGVWRGLEVTLTVGLRAQEPNHAALRAGPEHRVCSQRLSCPRAQPHTQQLTGSAWVSADTTGTEALPRVLPP